MSKQKVTFQDSDHRYMYAGIDYTSVSSLFKIVPEEKDWDYILSRSTVKAMEPDLYKEVSKEMGFDNPLLVEQMLKYINVEKFNEEKQKLKDTWKEKNVKATTRGTAFHSLKENEDYKRGHCVNLQDGKGYQTMEFEKDHDNESLVESLSDLVDGYYPELLVFNHHYKIAGQIDKCFVWTDDNGHRHIDIDDWKTDADIRKKPSFRHPKKGFQMFKFPFNHMYDCNYNTYTLKLSLYAWMLEDAGFIVNSIRFTSVDIEDDLTINSETPYEVPYKRWEVEQILKIHKNNT